ncbi:hypothetical protein AO398_11890 [Methylobacterium sp. GXS13]|nr:hypothetical protein AO398_11890 [Methylobacterium sp. GXS13]
MNIHHPQHRPVVQAQADEPAFAIVASQVFARQPKAAEDLGSLSESDQMLGLIGCILLGIPLKAQGEA